MMKYLSDGKPKTVVKAVVTAAGSGTRMLPATKEQPKEMLPVFVRGENGALRVKPFLQVVFERLYDARIRDICFVIGRGKRCIKDHFSLDHDFVQHLSDNNKAEVARELADFYEKVARSNIVFVNQPEPKGFGDAIFRARNFTKNEPFIVHAGDDLIVSGRNLYLSRLLDVFENYEADGAFYVQKMKDPRKYGVVTGKKVRPNLYYVTNIEEKPSSPTSNLATIAVYVFSSRIYSAIKKTTPDANNEVQLTNAIQRLVSDGRSVYALEIEKNEKRVEIGTPESYWRARSLLQTSKGNQEGDSHT